ncbi:CDP-alcohol phosphatidyltransferase [Nonlabens spongiae]|uniref:CDP-alcohol phosphatidyltransferase n=1 Tax=Nonlabens spongiae TaxID=331648 RepID=A0A1W6MPR0_9FLAO|nr:CDP-alcohol phosphatidyltransferase family protein [Nonlabens spongiae]ARN79506.1 CDP-alcohol phosphatidyltransferase [Nonlabens spongiae]
MLRVPQLLILFRLLCAPVILALAYYKVEYHTQIILSLMYMGLVSDILDGIIARKQNISSARLRRMDSQVDMVFWLSIGFATWFLYPKLIAENAIPIYAILAMEIVCYLISFIKFKRETCTHAFLSKLWGISLLIAITSSIGFNYAGFPFQLAIFMGLISHIDRILITLILPKCTHDIPSSYHAFLIRKGIDFKKNDLLNG